MSHRLHHHGTHGRWAFAEFTDVWDIDSGFAEKVADEFNEMLASVLVTS